MKTLATIAAFALLPALSISSADAQQTSPNLNVSGLKLGMTVDQAKAALLQHDPATQFTTTFAYLDNGAVDEWWEANKRNTPPAGTFMVPVEVTAGTIQHTYGLNHNEITGDANDPVYDVTGEWFGLRFTPNDNGGSLTSIIRYVNYPASDVDPATLPAVKPFYDEVVSAYGKPSSTDNSKRDFEWAFDNRGKLLSGTSQQFQRCDVQTLFPQGSTMQASGEEGSKTHRSDLTGVAGIVSIAHFLPQLYGTYVASNNGDHYRKCSVGMQVTIQTNDMAHIDDFVIFLADFDKTFFDDGVTAYLKSKAPAATAAPTPKL